MDAIELLMEDHAEVKKVFTRYEDTDSEDHELKAQLVEEICDLLTVHAIVEEELFYPAARERLGDSNDQEGLDLLEHAEEEHKAAKKMIADIKTMTTGFFLDIKIKALQIAIEDHVKEEENEMFPKLRQLGMEVIQLGQEMSARKQQLT